MFGYFLAFLCPFTLWAVLRVSRRPEDGALPLMRVFLVACVVRIALPNLVRTLPIYSYGGGAGTGDADTYEGFATRIALLWEHTGLHYITADEFPPVGNVSLVFNLFAFVIYLNGGEPTRTGCVALVALLACLTCWQLYRLAVDSGARPRPAFIAISTLLFSPGYLYLTSDTFKDGIAAFFVVTALANSFRLAQRLSPARLAFALVSLVALWSVRFYLIFLVSLPFFVGFLGTRSRSFLRPVLTLLVVGASIAVVVLGSRAGTVVSERVSQTFEAATSRDVTAENATGGSGVTFDDNGNPFGAIVPKVLYTLFSPFPWQGGSIALQVAKFDSILWYYCVYRIWVAARRLWREDRQLLFMFVSFLVPGTVAYATTMANIGLIARQRLPILLLGVVLAILSWPTAAGRLALAGAPVTRPPLPRLPVGVRRGPHRA